MNVKPQLKRQTFQKIVQVISSSQVSLKRQTDDRILLQIVK